MGQGEFEKQIRDDGYGGDRVEEGAYINPKEVLELVAAAYREFPEIEHIVPVNIVELAEAGKTKALADSVATVDGEKAAKWFEKWFGDADPR